MVREDKTAADSAFALTVSDPESNSAHIEPMLRAAMADYLISLERRVAISLRRGPVYQFKAVVRNVRWSRCQAVALLEQLGKIGVRDVKWVSVISPSSTHR
jgi:hypothetical protein